ncbi:protein AMN1 homolog [Octopus vulgaris]|uniref:Protein AMN1 homolog n=1 Tax=Octopus vulgaris TaxID=6645 RepID=A0AA36FIJ8_OCTVU|nr:protein AMN1 homolog [Octopus vulgaris]
MACSSSRRRYRAVPSSLLSRSMQIFLTNLENDGKSLQLLPVDLREKCLNYMSLRGLLSDQNLKNVIHNNLKKLDLSASSVTEAGLVNLNQCSKLQNLNLSSYHQEIRFSSLCLINSIKHCLSIQVLNLSRCHNVDDATVVALSRSCRNIHCLNLSQCSKVTDVAMQALGENCHYLRSIDFSRNSITDAGIASLVAGCCHNTLEEMVLRNIEKISNKSVELVLKFCPKLTIVNFSGCPNIQD